MPWRRGICIWRSWIQQYTYNPPPKREGVTNALTNSATNRFSRNMLQLNLKGKGHPRTGMKSRGGGADIWLYTFFTLGASWMWVGMCGGLTPRTGRCPPGKTRYPLYEMLGEPHTRPHGRVWKISPLPGFDPRTVRPYLVTTRIPTFTSQPEYRASSTWIFIFNKWELRNINRGVGRLWRYRNTWIAVRLTTL